MTVVESFLEKGILVSPEILDDPFLVSRLTLIKEDDLGNVDLISKEMLEAMLSKKIDDARKVKVISSYEKKAAKICVNDFVSYFNRRFEKLSGFLRQRSELEKTMSINRLKAKKDREQVSVIGIVYEKAVTKKSSIIITLEDPTGTINVLIRPDKKELYEAAKEVVVDEVIGVEGTISGGFIFANQICFPEIPLTKELKKGPVEEYVALLGDPHFGSNVFLNEEFEDFIEWINGRKGNDEQKEIASKIKYLIIAGDLVEGVGVYPGQEHDLEITDIKKQYDLFTDYLKKIPESISIIICPGNHDAGRLSEPQPPLIHKYSASLKELPNVYLVSNPAIVNLGATRDFPGFDFLIYHGYSFIYYANNVDSIRSKGGQKRPDLIMKFLLQRRHLAPSHTSNLYMPDSKEDPLVINHIPDFFISGHIHRLSASNYKNITMVNCSCWVAITEDQEKRGLQPQPGKIPVINLKSRDVKIMNFLRENRDEFGRLKDVTH